MIMVYLHNVTVLWVAFKAMRLSLTNYSVGFLEYGREPIQVSANSPFLYSTYISEVCDRLGFWGAFPLVKLVTRPITGSEVYRVDGCTESCYDIYLECRRFPFRLDDSGDIRVQFEGRWSALCLRQPLSFEQASVFCAKFDLPRSNAKVIPGSVGEYRDSWLWSSGRRLETDNCTLRELIAIKCDKLVPVHRLLDWGKGGTRGIFQIKIGDTWNSLCPISFSLNDATVACRSEGFPSTDTNYIWRRLGIQGYSKSNPGHFLCNGQERNLSSCEGLQREYSYCDSDYVVEISCDDAHEGKVRLTGGYDGLSGRLEIFHNNSWGAVCNNSFGEQEIHTTCFQITKGISKEGQHVNGLKVLPIITSSNISLDGVRCGHGEERLEQCLHKPWGEHTCSSNNIVHLACRENAKYRRNAISGLVEVYHDDQWGSICCLPGRCGKGEARVACKSAGLPDLEARVEKRLPAEGSNRTWLDRIECHGDEDHLRDCSTGVFGEIDSQCTYVVHIFCPFPDRSRTTVELRGLGSLEAGSVQYKDQSGAGGICTETRSLQTAIVACRTIGLPTGRVNFLPEYAMDSGYDWTYLNGLDCKGDEPHILDCNYTSRKTNTNCVRSHNLRVICGRSALQDYSLRLVNGNSTAGRLEVAMFGVWGTVCGTGFTNKSAKVACRQLGLPTSGSRVVATTVFERGTGPIWLNSLVCSGLENGLKNCSTSHSGHLPCSHGYDVGIICAEAKKAQSRNGVSVAVIACSVFAGLSAIPLLITIVIYVHAKRTPASRRPPVLRGLASRQNFFMARRSSVARHSSVARNPVDSLDHHDTIDTTHISMTPSSETPLPDVMKPPPSYSELFPETTA